MPVSGGTAYTGIALPTTALIPQSTSTGRLRITMISTGWDHAESRIPVSSVPSLDGTSTTYTWWRDMNGNGVIDSGEGSLPDNLVQIIMVDGQPVPKIGKVKVELSERRYSWLATSSVNANGDARTPG